VDAGAGLSARMSGGLVLDAAVKESNYNDNGPNLTYNFGSPIGNSSLYPISSTKDKNQYYQLFLGEGRYRLGAQQVSIDRLNTSTGQTQRNSYLSLQGAANPSDRLTITAGYFNQSENNSSTLNLSTNCTRLYLQAAYLFRNHLNFTARVGEDNREYSIQGGPFPKAKDRYYSLRGDYRPDRHWHLYGGFRTDNIDNPYFPTDASQKSVADAQASFTNKNLVAGVNYRGTTASNSINDWRQDEFTTYFSAQLQNSTAFNASYSLNRIGSNSSQTIFMQDPLGKMRPLQNNYPYWANNDSLAASLTIPMGKKNPWRFTPMYRWSFTESNADLLPQFPVIALASRLRIRQETTSLRLDFPASKDNVRAGIGWEYNQWKDEIRNYRSGSYNVYMLNLSKQL